MVVNMPMCNIYMKVLSSKKKSRPTDPIFFALDTITAL